MKKYLLLLVLNFTAVLSFANTHPPRPAPIPDSPVIAQVQRVAYFIPEGYPTSLEVKVHANGRVSCWLTYTDFVQVTELANLGPLLLAKLQESVKQVVAEPLEDLDPESPVCMDAPSTRFEALHETGKPIVLAKNEECKEFRKPNETSADSQIIQILDSLLMLGDVVIERMPDDM